MAGRWLVVLSLLVACGDSGPEAEQPSEEALEEAEESRVVARPSEAALRFAMIRERMSQPSREQLVQQVDGVWKAVAEGFEAHFDHHVELVDADVRVRLRSTHLRRGQHVVELGRAELAAHENEVSYQREAMSEWYRNGPLGLELGYDLPHRPGGEGDQVEIEVAIRGADPTLVGDRVELGDDSGTQFVVSDLFVEDSEGRLLPSSFAVEDGSLRIRFDDRDAVYPVVVDPLVWRWFQEITASDGASGDRFGWSVSISGNRAVVGAPYNDSAGTVYVFVWEARPPLFITRWYQDAYFYASDAGLNDHFGWDVSISGDRFVAGAPLWDGTGNDSGAVYVFERNVGTGIWSETQQIPRNTVGEQFGHSVALDGAKLIVGTPYSSTVRGDQAGYATIFELISGSWVVRSGIAGPAEITDDSHFGIDVDIDGTTAVIGTELGFPASPPLSDTPGRAFTYVRSGTSYVHQGSLIGSSGGVIDPYFGRTVAISGNTVIGGNDASLKNGPAAIVYTRSGTTWSRQARITPTSTEVGDVDVDGDRAYIATSFGVYIYARSGTTWSNAGLVYNETGLIPTGLGRSIAFDDSLGLAGSPNEDANEGTAQTYWRRLENGDVCSSGTLCFSGHCVDGVCCDSSCGGGSGSDCQVCNRSGMVGTCSPLAAGWVCRSSAGGCDVAETCDGSSLACPTDAFRASSYVCRPTTGDCDVAETCTGSSATCPTDDYRPSGFNCRARAGACDTAELCTGTNADCPADAYLPNGVECRETTGVCDPSETCTGSSAACPADVFRPSTFVCRASAGVCDVAETCTGSIGACPSDSFRPSSYECRASIGSCDVAETCTGASASCPVDVLRGPTYVCRPSAGDCDVAETCTGASLSCPTDAFAPNGTACPDGVVCNGDETCSSGACVMGADLDCDDDDPCTADGCAEPTGCFHDPIPGCGMDGGVDGGMDAGTDAGTDAGPIDAGFDAAFPDAGFDAAFPDATLPDGGEDGAVPDDAAVDAGGDGGGGGCGCVTPGASNEPSPAWALVLLGLVAHFRRRNR